MYPWEIRTRIAALEKLNLSTIDPEKLHTMVQKLIYKGYRNSGLRLRRGERLYRARVCTMPEYVSEIYYPPPEVTTPGRFNEAGKPVFYASITKNSVFFEVHPEVANTLAFSEWEVHDPLTCQVIGYTESALAKLGTEHRLPESYAAKIGESATKSSKTILEFFAAKITEDVTAENADHYKLTTAIGKVLHGGEHNPIDGLIYPTIAMAGNGHNIVLRASAADRSLQFRTVRFARVDGLGDNEFKISYIDAANQLDDDSRLKWKGRDLQWKLKKKGEQLVLRRDAVGWVAHDKFGAVVEPD